MLIERGAARSDVLV